VKDASINAFIINLAEVQLFNNNVQVPRDKLTLTLSTIYWAVENCNDGDFTTICHSNWGSADPNPSLTIVTTAVFDTVVVYNRQNCCSQRIEGATITATVGGISKSAMFPYSPDAIFYFVLSSSSLDLRAPTAALTRAPSSTLTPSYFPTAISTLVPSTIPTIAMTVSPTSPFSIVINNLVTIDDSLNYLAINLAEVQLFKNNVQVTRDKLTFTLSTEHGNGAFPARNCNDGDIGTICHSGWGLPDPSPYLIIVSTASFDKVVVYNRGDCCQMRIEGATIAATSDGISKSTIFPFSPSAVFTFVLSSSGLQLV